MKSAFWVVTQRWQFVRLPHYIHVHIAGEKRSLNYWSLLTKISHVYCILPIVRLFISLEISFQSSFHNPETYIISYLHAFFQVLPSMYWQQYQLSRFNVITLSYILPAHWPRANKNIVWIVEYNDERITSHIKHCTSIMTALQSLVGYLLFGKMNLIPKINFYLRDWLHWNYNQCDG